MKSERGVTLIALIIIVVILLILGGIAIHLAIKSVDEEIRTNSDFSNVTSTPEDIVEVETTEVSSIEENDELVVPVSTVDSNEETNETESSQEVSENTETSDNVQ